MFIADLHIHSAYSRATSKSSEPVSLDKVARQKGLQLIGSGDFTHPAYRSELREKLIPADGVYAVWASIDGSEPMQAMMNIGKRPTFNGKQRTLEVNILDFKGDLYGKQVAISFVKLVRLEQHFSSADELKRQIEKDEVLIRDIFEKIIK